MSIAEVMLILEREDKRQVMQTLMDTQSRHLANAGVHSEENARALRRYQRKLMKAVYE